MSQWLNLRSSQELCTHRISSGRSKAWTWATTEAVNSFLSRLLSRVWAGGGVVEAKMDAKEDGTRKTLGGGGF